MTGRRAPRRPGTSAPVQPFEINVARRVLEDAYAEAAAAYWLRRAERFEAARPRSGDFVGQATAAELAALDARVAAAAQACRNRAAAGDVNRCEFQTTLEDLGRLGGVTTWESAA